MNNNLIGSKLRLLRGDKTQKEVADSVNIATSTYAMYEAGCRIPRDEIKIRLAKYYGVTVDSIFFTD